MLTCIESALADDAWVMRINEHPTLFDAGMLLEMDSSSLIQLLDRPALLQEKMRLASEVLRTTSGAATSSDVQ